MTKRDLLAWVAMEINVRDTRRLWLDIVVLPGKSASGTELGDQLGEPVGVVGVFRVKLSQ